MQDNRTGFLHGVAAFSLAGSSVITAKLLSGRLPIFMTVFLSLLFALPCLVPVFVKNRTRIKNLRVSDVVLIGLEAATGMVLFRIFLLVGLRYTSAFHAGLITASSPLLMTVAVAMLEKRAPAKSSWPALVLITAGLVCLRGSGARDADQIGGAAGAIFGDVLVLGAVCMEVVMSVLRKKARAEVDALLNTAFIVLWACLLSLPLALAELTTLDRWPRLDAASLLGLAYYGIVATSLAYLFWSSACQKAQGAALGISMAAAPLCTAILSLALLQERPGFWAMAGMALAVGGIIRG